MYSKIFLLLTYSIVLNETLRVTSLNEIITPIDFIRVIISLSDRKEDLVSIYAEESSSIV